MRHSQKAAVQRYRSRLSERGLSRFEVLARDCDQALIRSLARRLAEDTAAAAKLRAMVGKVATGKSAKPGGILAALRRSPLVGADLHVTRSRASGRKITL
jgi:hypothetical protein